MKKFARALLVLTSTAAFLPTSTAWAQDKTDKPATDKPAADKPAPEKTAAEKAANDQEGRAHFLRGVDFSRDGDFRAALIEFRRAYDLAPNYRVLFNIGQTALELQEYAQSLDAFEKYLAEGGAEVPPARRTQVEAEVKRLSTRVAHVTINVSVPDASILVDDVLVGTSPLEHPLRVGAGRHKFSASTSDMLPVTRVLDLPGGENTTVNLELVAQNQMGPAPERTVIIQPTADTRPVSRTPLWVGIGVTSALAIGTAVVGVLTLQNKDDFDSQLGKYTADGNRSNIESARSSLKTTAVVFDVLALSTILAGGVTLVLGLSLPHRSSSPAPAAAWHPIKSPFGGTF
ncbi:MAG TPA: tetratricopeptide repeat protein [Labilithrix sp.]|nr:tetratricopeptide repeat protein [Labilithrix sp.]